ncbi:MAG: tetratricopeptide repeat protein [Nitrospirae bacterium]|nr:tetratricopeptide repeat protein [Nitrospirota bacterium]MCL5978224.1 tetratricopeptide repeat protein [Nitrospirota bacterium]
MAQITEAEEFFTKGLNELAAGHGLPALVNFEKALKIDHKPLYLSYIAYCTARERGQIGKAIELCEDAIKLEPENSILYLNLGKIYLHAGDREAAIRAFRAGLKHEMNREIINELIKLQTRKPPVIPFLSRNNPINKYLGIILTRLGLR